MADLVVKPKASPEAKPKTARRNVHVCDQGHYGSTTCSNCGANAEGHHDRCPKCRMKFEESDDVSYNTGGSDF